MDTDPLITVPRTSRTDVVIGALILHALLIAAWWWASIYADIGVPLVNGRVWCIAAWAWVFWPAHLLMRAKVTRGVVMALIFAAAIIAPTVPTIYTFTAWSIGGFAP